MPVTAQDFVFTLQAMRRQDPRVSCAALNAPVRSARAVEREDATSRAARALGRLAALFDHVLPRHVAARPGVRELWRDGIDNPRTSRPIGSGPFLLAGLERGRQLDARAGIRATGGRTLPTSSGSSSAGHGAATGPAREMTER